MPRENSGHATSGHKNAGAWEGPFTAAKREDGNIGDYCAIVDGRGNDFAMVHVEDCVGGDFAAAKARATRIAEALNAQHEKFTTSVVPMKERISGILDAANVAGHEIDHCSGCDIPETKRVNLPEGWKPGDIVPSGLTVHWTLRDLKRFVFVGDPVRQERHYFSGNYPEQGA